MNRPATTGHGRDARRNLAPVRAGRDLRMGSAAHLPQVCVGCGTRKGIRYVAQDFRYVPFVFYLVFPFIGVLALFFGALVRRSARIAIPRCPRCTQTAARSQNMVGPLTVGVVVLLFASATLAGNGLPLLGAVVAVVGIALFAIVYLRWIRIVYAAHIEDGVVTLRGIHEDALAKIAASGKHERSTNENS